RSPTTTPSPRTRPATATHRPRTPAEHGPRPRTGLPPCPIPFPTLSRREEPTMQPARARHALAAAIACAAVAIAALPALADGMTALVHKASVEVRGAPDFKAPAIATLQRDATLEVAGQQGLWFRVALADGSTGYVRVNDVRMAYAGAEGGDANVRALFTGKAGKGRVTETAGVRGLD